MRDDFSIKSDIIDALEKVQDPQREQDLVSLDMVEKVEVTGGTAKVVIVFADDRPAPERFAIEDAVYEALEGIEGLTEPTVLPTSKTGQGGAQAAAAAGAALPPPPAKGKGMRLHGGPSAPGGDGAPAGRPPAAAPAGGQPQQRTLEGVGQVIAVASGKGGVGKSTVAVNLALALSQRGHRVGLLDIDIYGPSLPTLLGIQERPAVRERRIIPIEAAGLRLMSLGFLMEEDTPVIWRGPIVTGIIRQFLQDVDWRGIDYLIVDMPPGTGDAQLSLAQTVPVDGAIVVTTPSDLALIDAARGLQMFKTLNVDVLGIVENMSHYLWPGKDEADALLTTLREQVSGEATATTDALQALIERHSKVFIFGEGGGAREAKRLDIELIGQIPLDSDVRRGGDEGKPVVIGDPDSPVTAAFLALADRVVASRPPGGDEEGDKKGVFSFLKG